MGSNLGAIPDQAFHTSIPFDIPLSQSQSAALSACASTSTGICSSTISSPTSSSVAPAICTTSSSSSLSLSEIPSTSVLSRAQPTSASSASITPSDILNSSVPPPDLANSTDSPPGTLLAEVTLQAADPNLTDGEFAIATTDDLLHLASVLDLDLPISSEINDIFSPKPNKSGSSVLSKVETPCVRNNNTYVRNYNNLLVTVSWYLMCWRDMKNPDDTRKKFRNVR